MKNIRNKPVIASPDHVYTLEEFKNLRIRKRDLAVVIKLSGDRYRRCIVSAHLLQLATKHLGINSWGFQFTQYEMDGVRGLHSSGFVYLSAFKPLEQEEDVKGQHMARYQSPFDNGREVQGRLISVSLS